MAIEPCMNPLLTTSKAKEVQQKKLNEADKKTRNNALNLINPLEEEFVDIELNDQKNQEDPLSSHTIKFIYDQSLVKSQKIISSIRLLLIPENDEIDYKLSQEIHKVYDALLDRVITQIKIWIRFLKHESAQRENFINLSKFISPITSDECQYANQFNKQLRKIEKSLVEFIKFSSQQPLKQLLPIAEKFLYDIQSIDISEEDDLMCLDVPITNPFITPSQPIPPEIDYQFLEYITDLNEVNIKNFICYVTAKKLRKMQFFNSAIDFEKQYTSTDIFQLLDQLTKLSHIAKTFKYHSFFNPESNEKLVKKEAQLLIMLKGIENEIDLYFIGLEDGPRLSIKVIEEAETFFNEKNDFVIQAIDHLRSDLLRDQELFFEYHKRTTFHEIGNLEAIRSRPIFKVLPKGQLVPFANIENDIKERVSEVEIKQKDNLFVLEEDEKTLSELVNIFPCPFMINIVASYIFEKKYDPKGLIFPIIEKFHKKQIKVFDIKLTNFLKQIKYLPGHVTQIINLNIIHKLLEKAHSAIKKAHMTIKSINSNPPE